MRYSRKRFQSSPALSSGRYTYSLLIVSQLSTSFNPRPPFRAGATVLLQNLLLPLTWGDFCANPEKDSHFPRQLLLHIHRISCSNNWLQPSRSCPLFSSAPGPRSQYQRLFKIDRRIHTVDLHIFLFGLDQPVHPQTVFFFLNDLQ